MSQAFTPEVKSRPCEDLSNSACYGIDGFPVLPIRTSMATNELPSTSACLLFFLAPCPFLLKMKKNFTSLIFHLPLLLIVNVSHFWGLTPQGHFQPLYLAVAMTSNFLFFSSFVNPLLHPLTFPIFHFLISFPVKALSDSWHSDLYRFG